MLPAPSRKKRSDVNTKIPLHVNESWELNPNMLRLVKFRDHKLSTNNDVSGIFLQVSMLYDIISKHKNSVRVGFVIIDQKKKHSNMEKINSNVQVYPN